jgi:hypothetical protein
LTDAEERDDGNDFGDPMSHVFVMSSRVGWSSQPKCGQVPARACLGVDGGADSWA